MRKKVLHIITGLEVGGAEMNLLKILPELQKKGFDNKVCCLVGHGVIGKQLEEYIKVEYLNIQGIFDFINPQKIHALGKIIKEFKPEIIETYLIHADLFGRIWGRFFGVKKIICNHRGSLLEWQWLSFFDKITSFLVTKYVFQTPSSQKDISEKIGIEIEKTEVIPNVINLADYNFEIDRIKKIEELGIEKGTINIVSVSNLRQGKGHKYLIEAFNKAYANGLKNINLIIVGNGDQRPILENQAKTSEAKENIFFLGKRSDVLEILKISDIFVLPTFYEGMSNAIMEAMASKLPIITTDIDVNKDLIKDGYSGILVPTKNSEKIAENLIKLVENPQERKRLGQNAFNEIQEKYSVEKVIDKISNLLLEI